MKIKRILAFLLVLSMALTCLPMAARADSAEEIPWDVYLEEPGSYTAIDGQAFHWTAPENGTYTFTIDSESNWSYFGYIGGCGMVYGDYGEDEFGYGPSFEMYIEAGATVRITLSCQESDPNGENTVDFTFTFEPDGTGTGGYVMESTHQVSGDGSEEAPYVYATIEDFMADWTNRKAPEGGQIFITAPLGGKTLTVRARYTNPNFQDMPWVDWQVRINYLDADGEIYDDYRSVFAMYEEPPVDTFTFDGAAFEELSQPPSYLEDYTLLDEPWQDGSMVTIAMFGPASSPYFMALDMIVEGVEVPEEPEEGEKTYSLGDLTGDGEVDIFDANLIVAFYNGTADLTAEQQTAADVNCDGDVDIFDANLVVSYYNGTIFSFPVEE